MSAQVEQLTVDPDAVGVAYPVSQVPVYVQELVPLVTLQVLAPVPLEQALQVKSVRGHKPGSVALHDAFGRSMPVVLTVVSYVQVAFAGQFAVSLPEQLLVQDL